MSSERDMPASTAVRSSCFNSAAVNRVETGNSFIGGSKESEGASSTTGVVETGADDRRNGNRARDGTAASVGPTL